MTQEEFNAILENHKKWLEENGGERANLNGETIPKIKAAIEGAEEICKEQGSVKLQKSVAACKEGIYQFLEVNSELLESFDKVVEYYKKTDAALN